MIELIENEKQFNGFDVSDIYAVRIFSLLKAYGCSYPFVRFYRQKNDFDEITAVLSVLDRDITVSFCENAEKEEICEFLSVIGYSTVLCDEKLELGSPFESGAVMKSNKTIELSMPDVEIDEYPPLFDLYNFIDYGLNNFEAWYVDINHRIRHGCAKAVTLNIDEEIISSAIFSSIYKNNAVLSGVQTNPEYRKNGCASLLVSNMCADFGGTVYLMRESGRNESFYKKLGFINTGKWRMYK